MLWGVGGLLWLLLGWVPTPDWKNCLLKNAHVYISYHTYLS